MERTEALRLPPGQTATAKWPVLHYGGIPRIDLASWEFTVSGEVEVPSRWTWEEFARLPRTTVRCDIHCVTAWSRFDNSFEGVAAAEVLRHARGRQEAGFVMVHSYGGYTTNLPLAALLDPDAIFAVAHDGTPLTHEHGWPCRLVVPKLYFWKSAKWVRGIELMLADRPGFWEQNGYHMRGDPWEEERYSDSW
ncbi:MAG TPA: sulfite oxidase-like oxidoreductase [bacterium]|nr:sulfite oxidase-like oxidoreductase [bacterium]